MSDDSNNTACSLLHVDLSATKTTGIHGLRLVSRCGHRCTSGESFDMQDTSFIAVSARLAIVSFLICPPFSPSTNVSRNLFVIFSLIFMPVVTIALIYIPGLNRAVFLERLQYVLIIM